MLSGNVIGEHTSRHLVNVSLKNWMRAGSICSVIDTSYIAWYNPFFTNTSSHVLPSKSLSRVIVILADALLGVWVYFSSV